MARGKVRCGLDVSPAENVAYCQPSYAHSTPIIPNPIPDKSASEKCSGHIIPALEDQPRPFASNTALIINNAATLIPVLQFCTSELRRVLNTLSAATTASISTAAIFASSGVNG